ncbi:hypothetical protein LJR118_004430 [Acidovorax sp. LjRoot118]
MAEMLYLVPYAGLEGVPVAIELMLESVAPRCSISVEHVCEVLARRNSPIIQ